jgi:hypothetical protein
MLLLPPAIECKTAASLVPSRMHFHPGFFALNFPSSAPAGYLTAISYLSFCYPESKRPRHDFSFSALDASVSLPNGDDVFFVTFLTDYSLVRWTLSKTNGFLNVSFSHTHTKQVARFFDSRALCSFRCIFVLVAICGR